MSTLDLRHGDCLGENGLKTIPDKSIDMICTDPPYAITGNHWDLPLDLNELFKEYNRIIKDNGAIVVFGNQPFSTDLIVANRKYFRYELIWEKGKGTDFFNANVKPIKSHENILIFYKKKPTYNPQKTEGKPYKKERTESRFHSTLGKELKPVATINEDGLRYPRTVLRFSYEAGKHTTQKPVPLCEWLIKTYTNEGDLVLDNTMGSGTTGVACVNTRRRFIGYEKDDKYFKVSCERINEARMKSLKLSEENLKKFDASLKKKGEVKKVPSKIDTISVKTI